MYTNVINTITFVKYFELTFVVIKQVLLNVFGINFKSVKEHSIRGRYVTPEQIDRFLQSSPHRGNIESLGTSVEGRTIYSLTKGSGPLRILMWSQMHGNESTTTKAVLDLINTLEVVSETSELILEHCTIKIIPMLNPDGAMAYTRVNAKGVDLNRDAQDLSQPESRILRKVYEDFQPSYCFNLHDQRTIFSVGNSPLPATISFLAPAADKERTITGARARSIELIVAMQQHLKEFLGKSIGRYDDVFNLNCVGDTFQSLGTPTILFEAGHAPGDYQRETTRKYIWYALLSGLLSLSRQQEYPESLKHYRSIPNNEKRYFDVLIRNAAHLINKYGPTDDVGILYKEILQNDKIIFEPQIERIGKLSDHFGHLELDCSDPEQSERLKKDKYLYSALI